MFFQQDLNWTTQRTLHNEASVKEGGAEPTVTLYIYHTTVVVKPLKRNRGRKRKTQILEYEGFLGERVVSFDNKKTSLLNRVRLVIARNEGGVNYK